MEVFMDNFLVFGNSFKNFLSRVDKMLKRCVDTNLCLNWENSHFMVKEGIVLGHKISKNGIKVDKAKVDVIAKLPHPTTVKGVRSFLGHAAPRGLPRRWTQISSGVPTADLWHATRYEENYRGTRGTSSLVDRVSYKLTMIGMYGNFLEIL
ncbi:hypothetical protein Tco_1295410 [Tanacetum coccineum]